MYQRRPADPTNPGDAADLSIMGYFYEKGKRRALAPRSTPPVCPTGTVAHRRNKINTFLTTAPTLHKQGKFGAASGWSRLIQINFC